MKCLIVLGLALTIGASAAGCRHSAGHDHAGRVIDCTNPYRGHGCLVADKLNDCKDFRGMLYHPHLDLSCFRKSAWARCFSFDPVWVPGPHYDCFP